jgi:hypothetical protein
MISREAFLTQLKLLIDKITNQLDLRENEISGIGSVSELRYILNELTTLENDLAKGKITSKNQRRLSSAWIVIDSWQGEDPLGEEICRLDRLYKTQLEEVD